MIYQFHFMYNITLSQMTLGKDNTDSERSFTVRLFYPFKGIYNICSLYTEPSETLKLLVELHKLLKLGLWLICGTAWLTGKKYFKI